MSSHDFTERPTTPQVPADSDYRGFDSDPTSTGTNPPGTTSTGTNPTGTTPSGHDSSSGAAEKAADAADSLKGPAEDVRASAMQAGRDVTDTAKFEARQVAQEAKHQGRKLLNEGAGEVRSQAGNLQAKLADTVDALTDELGVMSANTEADGPLTHFAGDAHDWGRRASSWLRENDPDAVVTSVRRYAARNPWTFLAIAAGAGLVAGRLARSLKDAESDSTPEPLLPPPGLDRHPEPGGYDVAPPVRGTYESHP